MLALRSRHSTELCRLAFYWALIWIDLFKSSPVQQQDFYMLLPDNKSDHMQQGPTTLRNVIHL